MAVEVANVANATTVVFDDSTAGGGTDMLGITSAATTGGVFRDYSELGGIIFGTGIYATVTGASSWIGVWVA